MQNHRSNPEGESQLASKVLELSAELARVRNLLNERDAELANANDRVRDFEFEVAHALQFVTPIPDSDSDYIVRVCVSKLRALVGGSR